MGSPEKPATPLEECVPRLQPDEARHTKRKAEPNHHPVELLLELLDRLGFREALPASADDEVLEHFTAHNEQCRCDDGLGGDVECPFDEIARDGSRFRELPYEHQHQKSIDDHQGLRQESDDLHVQDILGHCVDLEVCVVLRALRFVGKNFVALDDICEL